MSQNQAQDENKFTKKSMLGLFALIGAALFLIGYVTPRLQESASLNAVGEIERDVRVLKKQIDARYAGRDMSGISTEAVRSFAVQETVIKDGGPIRLSDLANLEVFPLENGEGYFFVLNGVREVACRGLYEKLSDAKVVVNGRVGQEGCDNRRLGNNMRIDFLPRDPA